MRESCTRFIRLLGLLLALGWSQASLRAQTTPAAGNDSEPGDPASPASYAAVVQADKPVAWWRFAGDGKATQSAGDALGPVVFRGKPAAGAAGPQGPKYPLFDVKNESLLFAGDGGAAKVKDPGEQSLLDFTLDDEITLEAWVYPTKLGSGQTAYVVGKGRTNNEGVARDNQNYGLRVEGDGNSAKISFLFRGAGNRPGVREDWHRWDSNSGFTIGGSWHYIAVSYRFGDPKSIRGYIDGKPVAGAWSYGGPTTAGPVVDNDELWIGSSMGGSPGSSFHGAIDEVAIYRQALAPERIAARYQAVLPKAYVTNVPLPEGAALVEVFEELPDNWSWDFIAPTPSERWTQNLFAFHEIPRKYNYQGVIDDRGRPTVIWMTGDVTFPAGKQRVLLRSRHGARLYVDGQLIAENKFPSGRTDGHNEVTEVKSDISPKIRALQPGDQEVAVEHTFSAGKHRLRLEFFIGGKKRRPELGETCVALAPAGGEEFQVLELGGAGFPLTDSGWWAFEDAEQARLVQTNAQRRRIASAEYDHYWAARKQASRDFVAGLPKIALPGEEAADRNPLDRFAEAAVQAKQLAALPLCDDSAFIRRVYIDLIGLTPTAEEVETFLRDERPDRRARLIDRLLEHPSWADNWMGYWLDVLAENPNIVNPTLNNTGPFRWWLHEAFYDNKPLDRLATELILMEGSLRYGGPAGFSLATENDAPFAAKSHVLAKAFLGMEMNCARCHDAPFHPHTQEQLFNLAAMLARGSQAVPKTSTVPPGGAKSGLITSALQPGQKIESAWPFAESIGAAPLHGLLRKPGDSREELAAQITAPQNRRFAEVLANRVWARFMGRGLVEPVDDWELGDKLHPELIEFLGREMTNRGYDLKQFVRLIVTSQLYQRQPTTDLALVKALAAPARRRMTAEQTLDSLFAAAGKPLHCEELSIDVDGSRLETSSISLGEPKRGWHFTSLSNERDRPSLSLPSAQPLVTLLEAFGWRASRQDPITGREKEPNVLQPAAVANGAATKRIGQLSEDSRFTEIGLTASTPAEAVRRYYLQILSREPTGEELSLAEALLAEGFAQRLTGLPAGEKPARPLRDGVSWSNHLKPKANEIRVARQKLVEQGDPPTTRLSAPWRERAEDLVWSLINSPEFLFVP